jgi:hypothetical protein
MGLLKKLFWKYGEEVDFSESRILSLKSGKVYSFVNVKLFNTITVLDGSGTVQYKDRGAFTIFYPGKKFGFSAGMENIVNIFEDSIIELKYRGINDKKI